MSIQLQLDQAWQSYGDDDLSAAETICQKILDKNDSQPSGLHLLGLIRSKQNHIAEALKLMERALELWPKVPGFHHNLAAVYSWAGRFEDARREYRLAIELKPEYGEAYQALCQIHKFSVDDPLIEKLHVQLKRDDLPELSRSFLHFSAGKIADDTADYKTAFAHYKEGNRLSGRRFNNKQFHQKVKDTLYVFSQARINVLKNIGCMTERPVFVIGMPRSGTTLVEQILASHSQVFGAGELSAIDDISQKATGQPQASSVPQVKGMSAIAIKALQLANPPPNYPNGIPHVSPLLYQSLADEYLQTIAALAGDESNIRVVDKAPINFRFLGLILTLFPQAKIIHTVRHPLDTCLSCFFQYFVNSQDYSFDLHSLAQFYNDYYRLMEHWDSVYPGRIYRVNYEDVIEDQQRETRGLLAHLELDFEEACLNYHQTQRKVTTASMSQVRKPLYTTSRGRWTHYKQELKEFAELIDVPLE